MKRARVLKGIKILHEDDDVIVIDKAAGLLVPAFARGTRGARVASVEGLLTDWVRKGQARSAKRVYLVHRLDRETSGVMVAAKTPEAETWFRSNWNELTEKTYLARVVGRLEAPEGVFESWLREDPRTYRVARVAGPEAGGRFARTEWKVLEESRGGTLVEVALKSGRKHQIRVQFAEAGHPVAGDAKYGNAKGRALCLHAWRLAFTHPRTGETLTFEAPPPAWARVTGGS